MTKFMLIQLMLEMISIAIIELYCILLCIVVIVVAGSTMVLMRLVDGTRGPSRGGGGGGGGDVAIDNELPATALSG